MIMFLKIEMYVEYEALVWQLYFSYQNSAYQGCVSFHGMKKELKILLSFILSSFFQILQYYLLSKACNFQKVHVYTYR